MAKPHDHSEAESPFLSVEDAEIVHGPDVIADKVSGALRDADRFGLPHVKPPLAEALDKVGGDKPPHGTDGEPAGQNALAGQAADIDEEAGSSEHLKPDAQAQRP